MARSKTCQTEVPSFELSSSPWRRKNRWVIQLGLNPDLMATQASKHFTDVPGSAFREGRTMTTISCASRAFQKQPRWFLAASATLLLVLNHCLRCTSPWPPAVSRRGTAVATSTVSWRWSLSFFTVSLSLASSSWVTFSSSCSLVAAWPRSFVNFFSFSSLSYMRIKRRHLPEPPFMSGDLPTSRIPHVTL